jgi:plastocyanin
MSKPDGSRAGRRVPASIAVSVAVVLGMLASPFPAAAAAPLEITSPAQLPDAHVGFPYSKQLQATGGTGSYVWGICTWWSSPDGITLSSSGLLSGSPDPSLYASTFTICATVTAGTETASALLELEIDVEDGDGPNPAIVTDELPGARSGHPFSFTFSARGGEGAPFTWQTCPGWSTPDGLTLSTAGLLSGTPSAAVSDTVIGVCVRVISGGATSRLFALRIDTPGAGVPPTFVTTALPDAIAGAAYSVALMATGGEGAPYTWELCEGWSAPEGMTLSAAGVLSGTASPSQGGATIGVCVSVESGNGRSGASTILPLYVKQVAMTWTITLRKATATPTALSISPGDFVKWTNRSGGRRTILDANGAVVKVLNKGTSFKLKLKRAGTYGYTEKVTGEAFSVTVA